MRFVYFGTVLVLLGLLVACGGGQTQTNNSPMLQSITVTGASANLTAGQSQQMKAMGTYNNGSLQDVTASATWSSSDTSVVTVAAGGLLTAKKAGSCSVGAKIGAVNGSFNLAVAPALVSISITPVNASIAPGTTQQFVATGTYSDGSSQNLTSSVTWTSSNTVDATVSSSTPTNGMAHGIAAGSSTISATMGSLSATASLVVTSASVSSIVVTPSGVALPLGITQQFLATATFSDGTSQMVTGVATWHSSAGSVASITASGLATARNIGSTTISATFGSVIGSTSLSVNAANLNSISITPSNGSTAQGTKTLLVATGIFNDGGTRNITSLVTWSCSDPSVAQVSPSTGLLVGLAPGSITLTATLGSLTSSVPFTVTNATIVSIAITPSAATIPIGGHVQFRATGVFSDSSTQDLTSSVAWSSSATAISTVGTNSSNYGLVTGISSGAATISAGYGFAGASATGTASLTVSTATLSSITLTPANAALAPASGLAYTALGNFTDGTTQSMSSYVSWTSSNTSVATINGVGLATGQAAGTTTVTAQAGSVSATASLIVESAALTSIQVTPQNSTIPTTVAVLFSATGTFANGDTQNLTTAVTWTSSTSSIATISNAQGSNGQATGLHPGSTTISAVFGGQVGAASLTVTSATLTSLAVAPSSASIGVGSSQPFTATGTFSDGSTANVSLLANWTSTSVGVATVNSHGVASGLSSGTSTIAASFDGVNANAVLTVQ